jgi:hypothetical protein
MGDADPVRFTDGPAQFIDANVGNGASFFLSNLYDISGQFYTRLHHEQSSGHTLQITGSTGIVLTTSNGDVLDMPIPTCSSNAPTPFGFNGVISDTAFSAVPPSIPKGHNFQIPELTIAEVPEHAALLLGLGHCQCSL